MINNLWNINEVVGKLLDESVDPLSINIDCTGDVVTGDIIKFQEPVWTTPYSGYRKYGPSNLPNPAEGSRGIIAKVLKDSFGKTGQRHTFTLQVLNSWGIDPLEVGKVVRRKGITIYHSGVFRMKWDNEDERKVATDDVASRSSDALTRRLNRNVQQNKSVPGDWL